MKVISAEEIEERFGVTAEQLEQWEEDACKAIFHGEPSGPVVTGPGRPMMFGEEMRQVGFKEPLSRVALIDARAEQLGLRRSDYLRDLVEKDLAASGLV
ncbi:MAG: toxin-antitoxin system antitoxin subunit [Coriobacteriia bacterium]|nr:toxin-antitoxin system antitoxin subunit [Coriobacteriia bacterium]